MQHIKTSKMEVNDESKKIYELPNILEIFSL